jgi:hypothetical protein
LRSYTLIHHMNRFYARVNEALSALTLLLGCWALYAQAGVLSGVSFATLRAFSFVPLAMATALFYAVRYRRPCSLAPPESTTTNPFRAAKTPPLHNTIRISIPFVIAVLYVLTHSDWLFWFLATSYLTIEAWLGQTVGRPRDVPAATSVLEPCLVLMLCAVAALLTAGARKPNADDANFVNVATAVIEFQDRVPQSFDSMHRDGSPPVEQTLHLTQVYEILVGLIASVSGVSVGTLYWIVLPPLWAVFGTLAHWLVLRQLSGRRQALWGTAIFVALLMFWGDGVQSFGNFGFVRLFQGKTICVVVVVPLIVIAAFRYRQQPGMTTWVSLAAAECAAAGLTANGIVIAPLAAWLAILARPRFDMTALRTTLIGAAASVPLLVVGVVWMQMRMTPYLSVLDVDPVLLGYATTLGSMRTPLILLALLSLPVLADRMRQTGAEWIAGYVWMVVLVIFMPAVSSFASGALGHVYSWRLFWAVPVPLLVALAGGVAIGGSTLGEWRIAGIVVAVAAFAISGPMAVSGNVWSLRNIGRMKVEDTLYTVAKETVAIARTDAPALVPEPVAIYVTAFSGAPPLIGVRAFYLFKLRNLIPPDELTTRLALLAYADGVTPELSVADALETIHVRGIATVVYRETHRDAPTLTTALSARGFVMHRVNGFVIAARPK